MAHKRRRRRGRGKKRAGSPPRRLHSKGQGYSWLAHSSTCKTHQGMGETARKWGRTANGKGRALTDAKLGLLMGKRKGRVS